MSLARHTARGEGGRGPDPSRWGGVIRYLPFTVMRPELGALGPEIQGKKRVARTGANAVVKRTLSAHLTRGAFRRPQLLQACHPQRCSWSWIRLLELELQRLNVTCAGFGIIFSRR